MKYLKRIFEGIEQSDIDELKDFCEMYLAYLMDDGWNVTVNNWSESKLFEKIDEMNVYISILPLQRTANWEDIKDHFIPFFSMLIKRYELVETLLRIRGVNARKFSLQKNVIKFCENSFTSENILNDEVPNKQEVKKIKITVKRKI